MNLEERVAARFLGKKAEVSRPTPMAGQEQQAGDQHQQPVAMAMEDAPDEDVWSPYEKRGEWNLLVYHPGGRRNLSYFMKNPSGGGGGSNDGTSVKALVDMVIRRTGWASPHINPHHKDKVWVSVLQWDGKDWAPLKQWWQPVPAELLVPKDAAPRSTQENFERLTR